MTEIRPIRDAEADTFLQVLCEVFDLDFNRAQGVFFQEPGFDLNRKWALFDRGRMVSILTTSPLQFGTHVGSGIAGVATLESERGRGHAKHLIESVMRAGSFHGDQFWLLFARDPALYQRAAFEVVDEVHEGTVETSGEWLTEESMPLASIRQRYEAWSQAAPDRLVRTALRWRLWEWSLRACAEWQDGYICFEGTTVREVVNCPPGPLPVPKQTQWTGLRHTTNQLGIAANTTGNGLFLMSRGLPFTPVMFMTDQF